MLKARVILLLTFCEGVLFRTKRFVPDYRYTQAFLGSTFADEICMVDVTPADRYDRAGFAACVQRLDAFCPVTVGGHIAGVKDVVWWLRNGADQVLVSDRRREGFPEIADKFGSQVLTAGVDYGCDPLPRAKMARRLGAGQILLNSIDRDGSLLGYDLETLRVVSAVLDCPVIVTGGCGTWRHMDEGFRNGASGCATSVIHHLTDSSMKACHDWLRANSPVPVRPAA